MPQFNHTEWKTWAAANGFHRIEAQRDHQGWTIQGQHSAFGPAVLPTRRGHPRIFASLDTAAKFLRAAGVSRWSVHDLEDGDLFPRSRDT